MDTCRVHLSMAGELDLPPISSPTFVYFHTISSPIRSTSIILLPYAKYVLTTGSVYLIHSAYALSNGTM